MNDSEEQLLNMKTIQSATSRGQTSNGDWYCDEMIAERPSKPVTNNHE